jgi:hypothetical protein
MSTAPIGLVTPDDDPDFAPTKAPSVLDDVRAALAGDSGEGGDELVLPVKGRPDFKVRFSTVVTYDRLQGRGRQRG